MAHQRKQLESANASRKRTTAAAGRKAGTRSSRSSRPPATPRQAAACAGPLDDLLNANLFKALSDPTRVKLLGCIAKCGRGCSVGEIAECCAVDLSVVSRHLALLARAGVLEASREGRTVLYRVQYAQLGGALRALAAALDGCCPGAQGGARGSCC